MCSYIVSRKKVICLEDGHIKFIERFKDINDRRLIINHLKEGKAKILFC